MPAGRLFDSIRFERRASSSDGYGNTLGSWATLVAAVRAEIKPIRGDERILADRLAGTTLFEVQVRSSAATRGVAPGDRAVNARTGLVYNIRAIVNPDQRARFIAMTCESGVADG